MYGENSMNLQIDKNKVLENNIKYIIDETTRFDFPFLASQEHKREIILKKKLYIEEKLKCLMPNFFPNEDILCEIWNESIKHTDKQFNFLSDNKKINGFYLQELSHCYAEKISSIILNNFYGGKDYGKIS